MEKISEKECQLGCYTFVALSWGHALIAVSSADEIVEKNREYRAI